MIYLAFNKPYGVLSQFTDRLRRKTLSSFDLPKGIYPCGRLDFDSEGLLILSDDGKFNQRVANPSFEKEKVYWLQVERNITIEAISKLKKGVLLRDGFFSAVDASIIDEPTLPPRIPPIRFRKTVPTSWLKLILNRGKNRQARRMLAAVGFPVLRLVRYSIGPVTIENIGQGNYRELTKEEVNFFYNF